jgi:hypothetical protein
VQNVKWTQVLLVGLVALVAFAVGVGILLLLFGGGRGVMGPGGMRGGWCPWCGGTERLGIGWLGAILGLSVACLLPLVLFALVFVGVVLLMRDR